MRAWMRHLIGAVAMLAMVVAALPVTAAQAQPAPDSYESPTYGYAVNWDPEIWTPDERAALEAAGQEAVDQLRLMHVSGATLHVVGGRFEYPDAEACVAAESSLLASETGVSDYGPVQLDDGEEMAGSEAGVAFAGFQLLFTPGEGDPLEMINFIECRLLPDSDVALVFTLISTPDRFDQHLSEAGVVNASLRLAQAEDAFTSPGAGTTEAGTTADLPEIDDAWFDEQVAAATANDSLFGATEGQLTQVPNRTTLADTGVDTANFFLRARIQAPTDPGDTAWDFGVAFREQSSGEHYRLVFDASTGWYLSLGVENDVQTGTTRALATAPGAVNTLELVAAGDVGAFRLNGELVGPLDLSALTDPGAISLGTAFFAVNTTVDQTLVYRDLQLWALPVEAVAATPEPETPVATEVATEEPEPVPTEMPEPVATEEPEQAPTEAPVETGVTPGEPVVVRLGAVNGSGVEGLAVLSPGEGGTTISLTLLGATTDQIGAVHAGTCATIDPLPAFALAGFDDSGRSTSLMNQAFDDASADPLAIVIHASAAEFGTVVACGEIRR